MIDAGNRADVVVIHRFRITGISDIIPDQTMIDIFCKRTLLLRGNQMILCKILLPVCNPVHQIDCNRLVYALILSHAEKAVLYGHQHCTGRTHQQRYSIGANVKGNLRQLFPRRVIPKPSHQDCRNSRQGNQSGGGTGAPEQPKGIQYKQTHAGHDPGTEPERNAQYQNFQHIALFPPDSHYGTGQQHTQQNDSRK